MRGLPRICSTKKLCGCFLTALLPCVALRLLTADRHWYNREAPCQYSEEHVKNQSKLAGLVSEVLREHGVDFFLCYGSLFGALRMGKSLPWDPDLEFCVINMEQFEGDEEISSWFRRKNVHLTFDKIENLYLISLGDVYAEIVLFGYNEDFTRVERKLFYGAVDSFPSYLVAPPLQKLPFHSQLLPVPRGDVDIQKYFYPDDWWKQVKPINCRASSGHHHHH